MTLKVPKPTSVILSPPDKAAETAETNPSTALSACDLVIPPSLAISATNSGFVIFFTPQDGWMMKNVSSLDLLTISRSTLSRIRAPKLKGNISTDSQFGLETKKPTPFFLWLTFFPSLLTYVSLE
jgi:hypothetical protein